MPDTYIFGLGVFIVMMLIVALYIETNKIVIYRFSRPTCPYCINSQAEWELFQTNLGLDMNLKTVDVNMSDGTRYSRELADYYRVSSVPSIIKVYPNGIAIKYDGPRTHRDLMAFAMDN